MRKIYVMLISCLSVMSFQSHAQECADESSALCEVQMSVNSLIEKVDLTEFKSQDALEDHSNGVCNLSQLDLASNKKTDSIVRDICLNKFSIAWMEATLDVNYSKISRLGLDVEENNVSLDKMTQLIKDKKAEIAQLQE